VPEARPTIAVTGSTGRLGGRVARPLAERGVPQQLMTRRPERAPHLPCATAVRGGYVDRVPQWQLDAWVSTYTAIAAGELDGVSDAVPRLTGSPVLVRMVGAGICHDQLPHKR